MGKPPKPYAVGYGRTIVFEGPGWYEGDRLPGVCKGWPRVHELRLPNARQARVEQEKITDYLLSATSPRGQIKAGFFSRFGFHLDGWRELAEALRVHGGAHEVTRVVETAYGLRYYVDGSIETPDGRNPQVRTVWQFDIGRDYPRLITAHPRRR